ncbi:MAG: hemerythrin domain-containing protein [Brumimicrobium sp.]|nr:hemerythrin domain-containing protein [Brumimicrobium sp.]
MQETVYNFLVQDHRRIEDILERAIENIHLVDEDLYTEFRIALLTHIKMEEKILFPLAQKGNNNQPLDLQAQLRLEHGAITSLMVLPPTPEMIKVLKYVLDKHDEKEEKEGGMYEICQHLTYAQTENLLEEFKNISLVPVHPTKNIAFAWEAAKRSLARAGFDYDKIVNDIK